MRVAPRRMAVRSVRVGEGYFQGYPLHAPYDLHDAMIGAGDFL